jgi:hypothetical protein
MQYGHPLAFLSKELGPKSRGLSTYERVYGHPFSSATTVTLSATGGVFHPY